MAAIPANQIPAEVPSNKSNEDQSTPGPHSSWQGIPPMYPFNPYFAHPPPPIPYPPYGYYPPHSMASPAAPTIPPHGVPASPATPTPPPHAQSVSMFSSPGTTMSHEVSLSDFCAKYQLTTQTQEKLATLDYTPGNKLVELLSEADWKEAGLSVLASRSFLAAHQKFCDAIRNGTWE